MGVVGGVVEGGVDGGVEGVEEMGEHADDDVGEDPDGEVEEVPADLGRGRGTSGRRRTMMQRWYKYREEREGLGGGWGGG